MNRVEDQSVYDGLSAQLETLDAKYVHIGIFDRNAVFRHKRVDRDKALKLARDGYAFCDVLYLWDTNEEVYGGGNFNDLPAALHADTLRPWPLGTGEALCIADFTGEFGALSARNQLLGQLERARRLGFTVHAAFEFEFNLFDETPETLRDKGFDNLKPFALANRTYSLRTAVEHGDLLSDFTTFLSSMGIEVDALHTELGPGCFEAPLCHAEGIRAADNAALFKNFAKAFFAARGLTACFMSKVRDDLPGQSGHLHISLTDTASGRPVFVDNGGLSDVAHHFIGGSMAAMPEWLALCAHTVNAYKRLVPGAWAPTYAAWGVQNRTAALRAIPGSPSATRLEFRVPSADTNPYAALAMLLASGLDGIEARTPAPEARADDCYLTPPAPETRFPRDLTEAADRLEASASARAAFGDAFIENFAEAARIEDRAYRAHVSAWDRQRYLEVV